jgi:hypothetical protein
MLVYHPGETSLGSIGRVTVSNKGVVMKSLSQSGYPAEWQTMMQDLKTACALRRVRASSSHSYYKAPVVRWRLVGQVDVNVDGMELVLSPEEGVTWRDPELGQVVVKGCSLGNEGVWVSVSGMISNDAFWLEIHVPMVATARTHA